MKSITIPRTALPIAALLLLAGVLTFSVLDTKAQGQLPEPRQMERETYLGRDITIKTALVGSVTVGYASKQDYDNGKHPVSPTVTLVRGASITHTLTVANGSQVFVRGGRIGYRERNTYGGEVLASDKSSVVFSGGMAYILSATQQSTVTLTGGTIESSVIVGEQGTMNLKGGTVKGDISAGPGGTLNLFGVNISKKLLRVGEPGYSVAYADQADQYVLSGKLSDGTALTGKILLVAKSGDGKVNIIKTR